MPEAENQRSMQVDQDGAGRAHHAHDDVLASGTSGDDAGRSVEHAHRGQRTGRPVAGAGDFGNGEVGPDDLAERPVQHPR